MCGKPADTFGGQCDRCASLQVLGLGINASAEEIEGAYLTLVKVWHPDRFQSDQKLKSAAEDKLKEINAAHDYLNSTPPVEEDRPFVQDPEPAPKPEEALKDEFVPTETTGEELAEEVRRVLKRYENRSRSTILFKVAAGLGGVAVLALLWFAMDFFLSENSISARPWDEFKAEVSREFHANGSRLWANLTANAHISKDEKALPPDPPTAQESGREQPPAAKVDTPGRARPVTAANDAHSAKPYLTSGLTPIEVLALLGNPTSSSGEKCSIKRRRLTLETGMCRDGRLIRTHQYG